MKGVVPIRLRGYSFKQMPNLATVLKKTNQIKTFHICIYLEPLENVVKCTDEGHISLFSPRFIWAGIAMNELFSVG